MENGFRELVHSEEGAENVRTRSIVLTGTFLFALTAATVVSAEKGGKHNGSAADQFLSGPACAVPEQESSSHMAFVRGRTRAGLIGGSYGEIFFASGASTRAAENAPRGSSGSVAATTVGGDTSATGGTAASGGGNGNGAATGGAAATTTTSASHDKDDPAATSAAGATGAASAAVADTSMGNGNGNGNGNSNGNNAGGNGKSNGTGPAAIGPGPAAVNPEPSTWLLLGTALCALFFVRSRQAQHHS
jgi:hypothetical protein